MAILHASLTTDDPRDIVTHILPLLDQMRGRLGMYLGDSSVTKLAAFLRGFDYAVVNRGLGKPDPFLAGFRDWIHQRFGSTAQSWEGTILSHSKDEGDAIRQFWELLGEYRGEYLPGLKSAEQLQCTRSTTSSNS